MSWEDVLCKGGRCTRATKKTSSSRKKKKWMKCVKNPEGKGYVRRHWGQAGVTVTGKRGNTKRKKKFRSRHNCKTCKGGDNSPRCLACGDW